MRLLAFGWLIVATPALADPTVSTCTPDAWLKQAERQPMEKRAPFLEKSFASEPKLACGAFDPNKLYANPLPLPQGCTLDKVFDCKFEGGLELDARAARDAGPTTYAKVQLTAAALRKAKILGPSHERLLMTWMLSAALAGEKRR